MRRRPKILFAVAALLAGGVAGIPVVARAAEDPVALTVIDWNICGEFAGCPKVDDPAGKVTQVKALTTARQADVVLLQEVCEWQANRLVVELNNRHDSSTTNDTDDWSMAFAPMRQIDTGHGFPGRRTRLCDLARYGTKTSIDHAFGVAVVVRGKLDQITTYELPAPTLTAYTFAPPLLCARQMPLDVRVCNTHFTPSTTDEGRLRAEQAQRVAEVLATFPQDRVVVAGDLNATPGEAVLNPLYAGLRECEQVTDARSGPPTTTWTGGQGKIDYIYVRSGESREAGLVSDCDTQPLTSTHRQWSDHTPLIGKFVL